MRAAVLLISFVSRNPCHSLFSRLAALWSVTRLRWLLFPNRLKVYYGLFIFRSTPLSEFSSKFAQLIKCIFPLGACRCTSPLSKFWGKVYFCALNGTGVPESLRPLSHWIRNLLLLWLINAERQGGEQGLGSSGNYAIDAMQTFRWLSARLNSTALEYPGQIHASAPSGAFDCKRVNQPRQNQLERGL